MSRQIIPLLCLSLTAGVALTAERFVSMTGGVPAAGAKCRGITRASGAIGERVPYDAQGVATVETGGAVAAGAELECDALGRAVTRTTGVIVARALLDESATAAGQFITVEIVTS